MGNKSKRKKDLMRNVVIKDKMIELMEKTVQVQLGDVREEMKQFLERLNKITDWIEGKFGVSLSLSNKEPNQFNTVTEKVDVTRTNNINPVIDFGNLQVEQIEIKIERAENTTTDSTDCLEGNMSPVATNDEVEEQESPDLFGEPFMNEAAPEPSLNTEKPFACEWADCGRSFRTKTGLNEHRNSAHIPSARIYQCSWENCVKKFATKNHLSAHMSTHTREKSVTCPQCGKIIANLGKLKQHQKTHSGERAFSCEHCDKKFIRKCHLVNHILLHTGERPFLCHYCDRSFTREDNLKTHMASHTDLKRFVCGVCGKRYRRADSFNYHRKTHFPKEKERKKKTKTESKVKVMMEVETESEIVGHSEISLLQLQTKGAKSATAT